MDTRRSFKGNLALGFHPGSFQYDIPRLAPYFLLFWLVKAHVLQNQVPQPYSREELNHHLFFHRRLLN